MLPLKYNLLMKRTFGGGINNLKNNGLYYYFSYQEN